MPSADPSEERSVERNAALLVAVGSRACCIPLAYVVETMRPLPVEAVAGMPHFVKGLAVIRGVPVPVVDLAAALGSGEKGLAARFVSLRLGDRRLALAVDAVMGVRELEGTRLESMPPLLGAASAELVAAIGTLDSHLLVVLRATRVLSEETWQTLDAHGAGR